MLAVVWAGALGGVALKMFWPTAPRWVGVPFYLAVGWVAIFVLPDLLRAGGVAVLVLMIAGGGALFDRRGVLRDPTPARVAGDLRLPRVLPRVCLAGGDLCHCVAIWLSLFAG